MWHRQAWRQKSVTTIPCWLSLYKYPSIISTNTISEIAKFVGHSRQCNNYNKKISYTPKEKFSRCYSELPRTETKKLQAPRDLPGSVAPLSLCHPPSRRLSLLSLTWESDLDKEKRVPGSVSHARRNAINMDSKTRTEAIDYAQRNIEEAPLPGLTQINEMPWAELWGRLHKMSSVWNPFTFRQCLPQHRKMVKHS